MWLKYKGFVENVNQWWLSYSFIGSHSFALTCKLKALKLNLKKWNMKKWNKEVFDNVKKQKMFFLDELRDLDIIAEDSSLSDVKKARN
jgi:hypothetical protein